MRYCHVTRGARIRFLILRSTGGSVATAFIFTTVSLVDMFAWGHYKDSASQTGFAATSKGWGCKMLKILWPPMQLTFSTSCNLDYWCVMTSPSPLFWVAMQRNLLIWLVTPGGSDSDSTSAWLWAKEMLLAYSLACAQAWSILFVIYCSCK